MSQTLSMIEARKKLTSLPEEFAKNPQSGEIIVTRHGKPVLAVLPWELYDSIMETLEIMGDGEMMAALKQGIQDVKNGKTYSWEEIKQELCL